MKQKNKNFFFLFNKCAFPDIVDSVNLAPIIRRQCKTSFQCGRTEFRQDRLGFLFGTGGVSVWKSREYIPGRDAGNAGFSLCPVK